MNKKITHARGIELAKSLILTFPIEQIDRLKLIAGSRGPGERRGTPSTHPPPPTYPPPFHLTESGMLVGKLQLNSSLVPMARSSLESLNEIDIVSTGSLRT